MTESNKILTANKTKQSLRRTVCGFLLASFLTLSGCSSFQLPTFGGAKNTADKALEDEISYIEQKRAEAKNSSIGSSKNLFARSLRSDKERIDRLERAVQNMRNEFESIRPSIRRLTALEGEIQTLIRELRTLNGDATPMVVPPRTVIQQQPVQPTIITQSSAPRIINNTAYNGGTTTYQKKSPPPAAGGKATIYDLRVGEHAGRTRIVMDSNAKTSFNVDIDNAERIAVIDLPNAAWSDKMAQSFAKSNFISSYKVEPSGNGHIVILKLKRGAKVSYKDDLKGTKGASRRLVLDLVGA